MVLQRDLVEKYDSLCYDFSKDSISIPFLTDVLTKCHQTLQTRILRLNADLSNVHLQFSHQISSHDMRVQVFD